MKGRRTCGSSSGTAISAVITVAMMVALTFAPQLQDARVDVDLDDFTTSEGAYLLTDAGGKSSLLRAGLIPRLRRKTDWVVVSPFEVAREPIRNLLERLGEAQTSLGIPHASAAFELVAKGAA